MSIGDDQDPVAILEWIDRAAEAYARAQANHKIAGERLKVAKASAFGSTQGTVAERESQALKSAEYTAALEQLEDAEYRKHLASIKMEHKKMEFEYWRTMSANKRQGIQ